MVKRTDKNKDKGRKFNTKRQNKRRQEKKKDPNKDTEEQNKADFYLDDADADLAYDSDEFKEEEEDDESEHGSDLDFKEEDYVSSDKEDEDEQGEEKEGKVKETVMTKSELKQLIKKANQGSMFSLTKVVIVFGKVTNPNNQPETLSPENIFSNSKIITKLIQYCIETLPDILQLKLSTQENNKKNTNDNKDKSSSMKSLCKRYISILSKYLKLCDQKMIEFIFINLSSFSSLIFLYNSFIEAFMKTAINVWATHPTESTRHESLIFLKDMIAQKPKYFEHAIKLFYIKYLDVAKAMNLTSYHIIEQQQDDIISILQLDLQKAYITIFVLIRKLCMQLRATIVDKTAASIKHIYNWQFVNSLLLWTKVIRKYYKSESDINLLAYPLIQTIIGVIRLNYSETFYLLRLRLVCALNEISKVSNIFIPVDIYLLPILSSNYFIEKVKGTGSNNNKRMKRLNAFTNLKIKPEEYKIKQIRKDLLEETCDCIIDFLSINAVKLCFEDLVNGITKQMRGALKKIYDKEYREIIKRTMEKIETNTTFIKENLSQAKNEMNIINPNTIYKFEYGLIKDKKCELYKQFLENKKKRKANLEVIEHQTEDTFIEV